MRRTAGWLLLAGVLVACDGESDRRTADTQAARDAKPARTLAATPARPAEPRAAPASGADDGPRPQEPPKSARQLVAEANALITTVPAPEAVERLGDGGVVFVDLREPDELSRLGWIPGAVHVPRGLLEFRIDSERPELRAAFHSGRRVLFYCAAGGRSALATRTAMVMGVEDVAHIGGGFRAWVEAGGPVARSGSQP